MTAWKLFEVEAPDGRIIRHRHENFAAAKKALLDGYKVTGEVLGASHDDKGGFVDPCGPGTKSILQTLLETRGDELLQWLLEHGFERERLMSLLSLAASLIRKEGPTPGDVHVSTALGEKPNKKTRQGGNGKKSDADEKDGDGEDVEGHLPVTNMTLAAQQITGQAKPTAKFAEVLKVDDSLGLVLGWAIVCKKDGADYWDLQEDHIPESSMLSAAVDFMQNSRMAKEMHSGESAGTVLFAFPMTEDIAKAFGVETKTTGLMIAMKPASADMLAKFKDGTYSGFSIGGARLEDEIIAAA